MSELDSREWRKVALAGSLSNGDQEAKVKATLETATVIKYRSDKYLFVELTETTTKAWSSINLGAIKVGKNNGTRRGGDEASCYTHRHYWQPFSYEHYWTHFLQWTK